MNSPHPAKCSGDAQDENSEALLSIRVFGKIGVPQNGWFIMENPIKMGDLGENPSF